MTLKEKIKQKWKSETVFVDKETGEIISSCLIQNGTYVIIKTHKTYRKDENTNKYNKEEGTNETYKTKSGLKLALPIYYRNYIYNEEEREKLWR